ncbi:hypothetical protein WS50_25755 [Burkholderia territorii]|uniref:hypothetical protein n=1 Tax=Burkholderia territorii TaxID=1503055 RepID=UPI00075811AF|nr:hypothetical protein [Burkholderia territorii]KUY85981.1 hypothetical protein WS47_26815 [Burkholderia territorii]KUZ09034.1 hypothetical protein WS50_25755 [Burkholderia territorii]
MDEVKEVFFAPSIEWFKAMAKQLRLHLRWDVKQYYASLNLLARIYGFTSWLDYLEYHGGDHAYETFWDSELDERAYDERRYMQTTVLMSALQIVEMDAVKILDEVQVSSQPRAASNLTERDEIREFRLPPRLLLNEVPQTEHVLDAPPAKPVVTYKKGRRRMCGRSFISESLPVTDVS